MTSLKETLWLTLEDLRAEEFKQLKWHLQQADIMHTIVPHGEAYRAIPTTRLEKADRQDTVDQMVQIYNLRGALEVTRGVLIKINRNDLVQQLPNITATSKAAWEVDVGDVGISSENRRDLMVPVPKPPQPITSYQKMLQSNLQNRFICVHEGLSDMEDKKLLDDIYTELYITDGGNMQINRQHEVRQIEMAARQPAKIEISVKPSDIFKHPSGKYRPIRTVLTNGIAGIGKTFLVQKFILDWAEGRNNQDVHLIFPFTFRQLNLLKGKRFCLAKLIHKCIRETKDITEDALNYIFTTLQTSGNTNYDKSKFKLLFVLDGLDENRLQLDFTAKETKVLDVTKSTGVEGLLMNLIKGTLLPSSRLWITTRPAAANQISLELVDMVSEVRGFTDPQKEEYFTKKFSHHGHADRIISHIRASRSLYIMCYIPVFCWITATVLQDVLQTSEGVELPKTLTEMYTEFLAFQMKQTKEKYGTKKCIRYIESLAKLAFHQLDKGNIIFYEEDLKHSGIDLSEASMYSGVFTQIFKRERWRKKDKEKGRMFSFVHLSIQEFLAAFYVQLSLVNGSKNVMAESQAVSRNLGGFFCKTSATEVHRSAIDKALASPEGHLDLFLRFLLGLSLQTNKDLLADLLGRKPMSPSSNQETIQYIKEKIEQDLSPERSINLFHCLNELNDHSLVEDIQDYISSGCIFQRYLTPAQWSGLVFILLSSEKKHDVFDLKKYSASHGGLLRLLPVFQDSTTYLLNLCKLSSVSCEALASVLSSRSSCLRQLDLSNNDLLDSGVKLLAAGLANPRCRLETLRLSGCLVTEEGCASLASALSSNPSHLRELDLSYNHPGVSGAAPLSAGLDDPRWRLDTLKVDPSGVCWLKSGLRKYAGELTLDLNTAHRDLVLSDGNRSVTKGDDEQPYPDGPERFCDVFQLLCREGLTGRRYWEVEWKGRVWIGAAYSGISRSGKAVHCLLGGNEKSWCLECTDDAYYSWHNKSITSIWFHPLDTTRVAAYLDWPAGTLSFYRLSSDTVTHLYTFYSTFDEPVYPGFWIGLNCSATLCQMEEEAEEEELSPV
ncbi:putative NACHT LRR and PYD domains-containing protein 12-like [Scophthalmus maximus]|uniref:Putative NACHT LRR and PYD domains-containing protein 12-like n=1 Tax=Scophthalmus maximus TaxID=52904 RepID=A0A2U9CV97_SCOMX|nr:putative NACHT LRR and PYD domains-containing protein 12-like [Scophthalmus maximus]